MRVTVEKKLRRATGRSNCILTSSAGIEGSNGSPLSGALLASLVQNLGHHGLTIIVLELEDVCGDLDLERVEDTLVPSQEDVSNFVLAEIKTALEDVVGLSNELHVTVFDTWVQWSLNLAALEVGLDLPLWTILT